MNTIVIHVDGVEVLLSAEDRDLLGFRWTLFDGRGTPYIARYERRSTILLHRVIGSRIVDRPLRRDEQIDHINGNTMDNRRSNLRIATHAENVRNRLAQRNNKSGYKGVYFHARSQRWRATIQHEGKRHYLGSFDTAELASAAYTAAADRLYGAFAPDPDLWEHKHRAEGSVSAEPNSVYNREF